MHAARFGVLCLRGTCRGPCMRPWDLIWDLHTLQPVFVVVGLCWHVRWYLPLQFSPGIALWQYPEAAEGTGCRNRPWPRRLEGMPGAE